MIYNMFKNLLNNLRAITMYKNSLQEVLSCLKYQILIFQFTQGWTIHLNYKKERNSWNSCYLLSKEWNHEFTANLL